MPLTWSSGRTSRGGGAHEETSVHATLGGKGGRQPGGAPRSQAKPRFVAPPHQWKPKEALGAALYLKLLYFEPFGRTPSRFWSPAKQTLGRMRLSHPTSDGIKPNHCLVATTVFLKWVWASPTTTPDYHHHSPQKPSTAFAASPSHSPLSALSNKG